MQALLVFLVLSAVAGTRSHRNESPIAHATLIVFCILLAIAFTSRRVV